MRFAIFLLITVLVLLGSTTVEAAKCKYQWDTVNYRTGEKILWSKWVMNRAFFTDAPRAYISGVIEGDQKYLGVQIASFDQRTERRPTKQELDAAMVVPEGAKLSIVMEDGTTLDLFADEAVIGDTSVKVDAIDSYAYRSHAIIRFKLDTESLSALSAQKAREFSLATPKRNYEISFGKKPSDKIQEALACIP